MSEGGVSGKVAGQEVAGCRELFADESEAEEPGSHRVFRVFVLLRFRACAPRLLRHLAEGEAKLDVTLQLAGVNSALPFFGRGVELEKSELDRLSEYSDKRSYPNKIFIRSFSWV